MNFRYNHDFEDGTFIKYLVQADNLEFYCGSGRFTDNIQKAKTYYRLCDAKNAITTFYYSHKTEKTKLFVVEYHIEQHVECIFPLPIK